MSAGKLKQRIIGFMLLFILVLFGVPLLLQKLNRHEQLSMTTRSQAIPALPAAPKALSEASEQAVMARLRQLEAEQAAVMARAAAATATPVAKQPTITVATTTPAVTASTNASAKLATPQTIPQRVRRPAERAPEIVAKPSAPQVASRATAQKQAVIAQGEPVKAAKPRVAASAAKQQQQPVAASKHVAWIVQLGSFASHANAHKLVGELQASGYAAYARPSKSARGAIYRVLVGPVIKRQRARDLMRELDRRYRLQGLVLQTFDPLRD